MHFFAWIGWIEFFSFSFVPSKQEAAPHHWWAYYFTLVCKCRVTSDCFKDFILKDSFQMSFLYNFVELLFSLPEIQRGNLKRAIELFNKAIPLTNTELEMAHLFGLRDAAMAQITVQARLGMELPNLGHMDWEDTERHLPCALPASRVHRRLFSISIVPPPSPPPPPPLQFMIHTRYLFCTVWNHMMVFREE